MPQVPTKPLVEEVCRRLLDMGIGPDGRGSVVIRCGAMGACIAAKGSSYTWIDAYWNSENSGKVVDVTGNHSTPMSYAAHANDVPPGAGNSFLGGLGAGLVLSEGNVRQGTRAILDSEELTGLMESHVATLYATVSASFTIEQAGLPHLTQILDETGKLVERWNGGSPRQRLQELQNRLGRKLQSE